MPDFARATPETVLAALGNAQRLASYVGQRALGVPDAGGVAVTTSARALSAFVGRSSG